MKILQLIEQTKEQGLTKSKLEELYESFLSLFAATELRIAELEREEALFMERAKESTVASGKRSWSAIPKGQELITLKRQSKVIEKYMSSVKHKIFSQY
jgi:hypothetical protein